MDAVAASHAEGIVHAAAVIGQSEGAADPLAMYRINVDGTSGQMLRQCDTRRGDAF